MLEVGWKRLNATAWKDSGEADGAAEGTDPRDVAQLKAWRDEGWSRISMIS